MDVTRSKDYTKVKRHLKPGQLRKLRRWLRRVQTDTRRWLRQGQSRRVPTDLNYAATIRNRVFSLIHALSDPASPDRLLHNPDKFAEGVILARPETLIRIPREYIEIDLTKVVNQKGLML